jgi:two-component system sensor histidine kinase UhpB
MGKKNNNNFERIILDNIPFLAWHKDNEGKYIMVNEAFAQAYHLRPEDIIGKTDFDICSYDKALEFQRNDEEIRRLGERQFVEQIEELSKGPTLFETYKTPIRDSEGNIIGISGI